MSVQDLMTQAVCKVGPDDGLHTAARLMWEHDCGSVPVVDVDGRVVAMITDRDICMAAYTQGKRLSSIRVKTAMSRSLITCRPDASVRAAEAAMRSHQVRRLPVVDDDGRLVGILSLNDLAIETKEEPSQKGGEVTTSEVGRTLAAISRHRMTPPTVFEA